MALSNFLLTVLGVGAVWMIVRSDLRQSSAVLSRNIKHIRTWLEKEAAEATKKEAGVKAKELEHHSVDKTIPKEDKH